MTSNEPIISGFMGASNRSLFTEALFDEVLEGLESIHNAGLVHMDMKPATGQMASRMPQMWCTVIVLYGFP